MTTSELRIRDEQFEAIRDFLYGRASNPDDAWFNIRLATKTKCTCDEDLRTLTAEQASAALERLEREFPKRSVTTQAEALKRHLADKKTGT